MTESDTPTTPHNGGSPGTSPQGSQAADRACAWGTVSFVGTRFYIDCACGWSASGFDFIADAQDARRLHVEARQEARHA